MTTPPQNVAPLNTGGQNFIKFHLKKNVGSNVFMTGKMKIPMIHLMINILAPHYQNWTIYDYFVQCKEDARKLDVTVLLLL